VVSLELLHGAKAAGIGGKQPRANMLRFPSRSIANQRGKFSRQLDVPGIHPTARDPEMNRPATHAEDLAQLLPSET
jgi:hypothetical protein